VTGLAQLQLKVSVDESWLDYLIIGIYFLFVLGMSWASPRRRAAHNNG
jgi:hypothetical protein